MNTPPRAAPGPPDSTAQRVSFWLLVALSFVSALIGFGFAAFYVIPGLWDALAGPQPPLGPGIHLVAAVGFAVLQVVAALRLLERRSVFIRWLAPAALYLMAIGLFAWLARGEWLALWLDTLRGSCLLGLGIWNLRALRGPVHASPAQRRNGDP